MFNMSGQSALNERPSLHPLTVPPNDSTILIPSHHQLISPCSSLVSPSSSVASSSSGPPSPHSDLYSPSDIFHSAAQQQQQQPNPPSSSQPLGSDAELHLADFDYSNYGWENNMWTTTTTGATGVGAAVANEDILFEEFDLASIPAIEIGLSKMSEEAVGVGVGVGVVGQEENGNVVFGHVVGTLGSSYQDEQLQPHARHESLEGLFDFEDMIASNGY
jgi:hypothetical protein